MDPAWWWSLKADAAWTNRSLPEIRGAAEGGDPVAQVYLARAWYLGLGGSRDPHQALAWTRRAAEQGNADAQFLMARFHFAGLATNRDDVVALRWLDRAVAQRHADAMALLGRAQEYGQGTAINPVRAEQSYRQAAAAGSMTALVWLGYFFLNGESGTARRTNYTEALAWFDRAATNGHLGALVTVADFAERGVGTPPDFERALRGFRHGADRGNVDAMERLASLYAAGRAEPRGPEDLPIHWLRRAAVRRAIHAFQANEFDEPLIHDCLELNSRYRFGVGTQRDHLAAAQWFCVGRRVALMPRPAHLIPLHPALPPTNPFEWGPESTTSPPPTSEERLWRRAVRWIREALEEGQPDAWYRIGQSYVQGSALGPRQPPLGRPWLVRATELGHAGARTALQNLDATLTPEELAKAKRHWVPLWSK